MQFHETSLNSIDKPMKSMVKSHVAWVIHNISMGFPEPRQDFLSQLASSEADKKQAPGDHVYLVGGLEDGFYYFPF